MHASPSPAPNLTAPQTGPLALLRSAAPFLVALALALAMQLLVRPSIDAFAGKLLLDIATNVVLAVSLTIVNGFTGQFSMGHAAFMLVGAYVSATIVYYGSMLAFGDASMRGGVLSGMTGRSTGFFSTAEVLFLVSLVAGGLVAAGCGYLVGLPSLRLRGDYLAIVTLGFGEIARRLIEVLTTDVLTSAEQVKQVPVWQLPRHTGAALGFTGLPFYTSLFWTFLVAGITIVVAIRLKRGTFGRAFLSIREDEIAAEAMGVHTTRYKIWAFVIAAFFAGCAGGLYAHTSGVQLAAADLAFQRSFEFIIMVVLGGLGSISGATIAAIILTLLPEWLRSPGVIWPYALAVLVVCAAIPRTRTPRTLMTILVIALALETLRWMFVRFGPSWGISLSELRMVLYALMLILMMILRPQGLLGVRELWDKELWRELLAPRRRP